MEKQMKRGIIFMKQLRIFACEGCEDVIEVLRSGDGARFTCCGQEMKELTANTSEGAAEKHIPFVEQNGSEVIVTVGSVAHPMTDEHSINFVYLETEKSLQRVELKPDEAPKACFNLAEGDRPVAAYAFCNLHGFWKTTI